MAPRIRIRLGVVGDADRAPGTADRLFIVEPTVGATARSKGSFYLLVTDLDGTGRAGAAVTLVGEAIRDQYYYDESAGIRVVLEKSIAAANQRLLVEGPRLGLVPDEKGSGPIGIALAVVRAGDLYVATVGPAQAYFARGGRLATLPDPNRGRGLPSPGLEPSAWRGDIALGDRLTLVSEHVVAKLGLEGLQDALAHAPADDPAGELARRFRAAGGRGSDGILALTAEDASLAPPVSEPARRSVAGAATGVGGSASTGAPPLPVPLALPQPAPIKPDRSPIPGAEAAARGIARVRRAFGAAGGAIGGAVSGTLGRLINLLPRRSSAGKRVTGLASRRAAQQRFGVIVLAVAALAAGAALVLYISGNDRPPDLGSLAAGERAIHVAQTNLEKITKNGVDLVADDPAVAEPLLVEAYQQVQVAAEAGIPSVTVDPLRIQITALLDRLYHMIDVAPRVLFSFARLQGVDLQSLVIGPDGAYYVLDRGSRSVYRMDLKGRKAVPIVKSGSISVTGAKVAEPRLIGVGGPDLLILDSKFVLWRWRPADRKGNGTLTRIPVSGSNTWSSDVRAIGTFVRNADAGLYNLYVVDPAAKQIQRYSPAADGNGYPAAPTGYLQVPADLSGVTQLYIDGDIFVVNNGQLVRYVSGTSRDWTADGPGDVVLRPAPTYRLIASSAPPRSGLIYAWDQANARVVAFEKATGRYREQYRIAGGGPDWSDVRGIVVNAPQDGTQPTLTWIDGSRLMAAKLVGVASGTPAIGSPTPSGPPPASPVIVTDATDTTSPTPAATVAPTPTPSKKP